MLISRFAPSPTGLLHLGHAYSAFLTQNLVENNSGSLLLRIEDIDKTRCTSDFEKQIYRDLKWLGIHWNDTPIRQSDRLSCYSYYLKKLAKKGLTYGCDCTRSDIKRALSAPNRSRKNSNTPVYPGTCREKNLSLDNQNIRLNIVKSIAYLKKNTLNFYEQGTGPNGESGAQVVSLDFLAKNYGDFIIARRDINTSYHLSVTVDDAYQKITHVSRGNDLFYITPMHILLQKLLDFNTPKYVHHPLITDNHGHKLSKSKGSESILNLRDSGKDLETIKSMLICNSK